MFKYSWIGILLLFTFPGAAVMGQSCYTLEYESIRGSSTVPSRGRLEFEPDRSLYTETSPPEVSVTQIQGGALTDRDVSALSEGIPLNTAYVYYDLATDTLVQSLGVGGNTLIVEPVPVIDWEIDHDSTRTIGELPCFSASGRFAGRDYHAWFTYAISVPFGPYKFHGLPGMVVELTSTDNQVNYLLQRIERVGCGNLTAPDIDGKPQQTHREWFSAYQHRLDKFAERLKALAGPGERIEGSFKVNSQIELYDN